MKNEHTWIEVTIPAGPESFEVLENFLFEQGSCGTTEAEEAVRGYFSQSQINEQIKNQLNIYIKNLRKLGHQIKTPVYTEIPQEDWNTNWRKYFTPVQVTPNILVTPPWIGHENRTDQIVIEIMPRMAFGTGTHETTKLCLEMLADTIRPNDHVLDVGTGSGILAIGAAKMGAVRVLGIDIDENAIDNATENVRQNRVEACVEIRSGSIDSARDEKFHLICANINRKTLVPMVEAMKKNLHAGGRIILSGILKSEEQEVMIPIQKAGLVCKDKKQSGEWIGLLLQWAQRSNNLRIR
jgi:ribosomal protein L11 methyltransferase